MEWSMIRLSLVMLGLPWVVVIFVVTYLLYRHADGSR